MNTAIDFGTIIGELHTVSPQQKHPSVDLTDQYSSLIFKSAFVDLKMRDVTGSLKFSEEHIGTTESGQEVLYPEVLETEISLYYKSEQLDSELYQTEIGVQYVSTQDQFYILTQFDLGTYGPSYFWYQENLYKIYSSPYKDYPKQGTEDPFLKTTVSETEFVVQNLFTQQTRAIPKSELKARLEDNPEVHGALPLANINGEYIMRTVKEQLAND